MGQATCEEEALELARSPRAEIYFIWFCTTSTPSFLDNWFNNGISFSPGSCSKGGLPIFASILKHKDAFVRPHLARWLPLVLVLQHVNTNCQITWLHCPLSIHGFEYITSLQHSNFRVNYDAAREARPENGAHYYLSVSIGLNYRLVVLMCWPAVTTKCDWEAQDIALVEFPHIS